MKEVKEQAIWIPARSIPGNGARPRKVLGMDMSSVCLNGWTGNSIRKGCKDGQQCLHLWGAVVEYGKKDRQ